MNVYCMADALQWGEGRLKHAGVENADMEARWLLSYQMDKNRSSTNGTISHDLYVHPLNLILEKNQSLPAAARKKYEREIGKRSRGIPLAYILKSQEFMGFDFFVNQDVLVPRPETETVVNVVVRRTSGSKSQRVLDIGTGTGNIAVVIAKLRPDFDIVATDISRKAIAIAKRNAKIHGAENIAFLKGDLFSAIHRMSSAVNEQFDIIVSNPPYVRTDEIAGLQKEIQYEPRLALDGGRNGLRVTTRIISEGRKFLKKGGMLSVEIGHDQSQSVKKLMRDSGYRDAEIIKDNSGIDRVAIAKNG